LADHFARWAIVLALGQCFKPWALSAHQRRHDARPRLAIPRCLTVPEANSQPGIALLVELEIGRGAEDHGLNKWHRAFLLAGFLPLEQSAELFGLQVGGDERVIDRGELAIRLPGPCSRVTEKPAGTALDLDQEQALGF
jgi:hypothetical protein